MEYIYTPDSYKFVEINPRGFFWSSLATPCGINLYRIMYDDMVHGTVNPASCIQNDRRLIWYDLEALPDYFCYPSKCIGVFRFLTTNKMEAILSVRDIRVATARIMWFLQVQYWKPWKYKFKRRIKQVIRKL